MQQCAKLQQTVFVQKNLTNEQKSSCFKRKIKLKKFHKREQLLRYCNGRSHFFDILFLKCL